MEYFTDNLNIISAEIEKARLEKELALLRTIEDGRRRKARDEAKMILLKPEKLIQKKYKNFIKIQKILKFLVLC